MPPKPLSKVRSFYGKAFTKVIDKVRMNLHWKGKVDHSSLLENITFFEPLDQLVKEKDKESKTLSEDDPFDIIEKYMKKEPLFSSQVKEIFKKNPIHRTRKDLLAMTEILKTFDALQGYSKDLIYKLSSELRHLEIPFGRVILRQGHAPLSCYFILSGKAWVRVQQYDMTTGKLKNAHKRKPFEPPTCPLGLPYLETVKLLKTGSLFGEIALLHGCGRTASVISREPMELLELDGFSFSVLLHDLLMEKFIRRLKILKSLPCFFEWTEEQLKDCCNHCILRTLRQDTVVLSNCQEPKEYFYCVLSGKCTVTREMILWQQGGVYYPKLIEFSKEDIKRSMLSVKMSLISREPSIGMFLTIHSDQGTEQRRSHIPSRKPDFTLQYTEVASQKKQKLCTVTARSIPIVTKIDLTEKNPFSKLKFQKPLDKCYIMLPNFVKCKTGESLYSSTLKDSLQTKISKPTKTYPKHFRSKSSVKDKTSSNKDTFESKNLTTEIKSEPPPLPKVKKNCTSEANLRFQNKNYSEKILNPVLHMSKYLKNRPFCCYPSVILGGMEIIPEERKTKQCNHLDKLPPIHLEKHFLTVAEFNQMQIFGLGTAFIEVWGNRFLKRSR